MKIFIAPLNWGLGHATRCIPLIRYYLAQGDEVVLGGDGKSLVLLRRHFPQLRVVDLPSLELRYTHNHQQRGFYLRAVPALIRFTIADHYYLRQRLAMEHFDLVISDNRFGLFTRQTRCAYITHQLYVRMPKRLKLFEPLARVVHACIYKRFNEVWVPDYADPTNNLSGALSHGGRFDRHAKYIGPLSRFSNLESGSLHLEKPTGLQKPEAGHPILAVLSGLEPQRTLFEQALIDRFKDSTQPVLIVRGKIGGPATTTQIGAVTLVPHMNDEQLVPLMLQAKKIIVRSGYSTIMDLSVLGLLSKAEFHPTPGQSEQEYLSTLTSHL